MATVLDSDTKIRDFDPFGMDFRTNPSAYQQDLISNSPIFVKMEGVTSAIVASYAQCTAVIRNFKGFSSVKPKGLPGMERVDFFNGAPVMNYSDPPDHTRRRKVVNPAFTPKRTEVLLENAEILVNKLIDQMLAKGEFEAVDELCKLISVDTLMDNFLGIKDPAHKQVFFSFVGTLPLLDKMRPGDPKPDAYLAAWDAGVVFCQEQQALAREGKCDNLIGLIANSADGGAIDDAEMMAMMIVLLTGGFTTVAGATAAALYHVVNTPGLRQRLVENPALAGAVVEEAMRMDPPVSLVMRFATDNITVGDEVIPAGMPVYTMISVANKDPSVFPDPYMFNPDRENVKDQIAFGQGMHTCIGNAITRNVVPMVIRMCAERMPNLRLSDREEPVTYDVSTPRARHLGQLWLKC